MHHTYTIYVHQVHTKCIPSAYQVHTKCIHHVHTYIHTYITYIHQVILQAIHAFISLLKHIIIIPNSYALYCFYTHLPLHLNHCNYTTYSARTILTLFFCFHCVNSSRFFPTSSDIRFVLFFIPVMAEESAATASLHDISTRHESTIRQHLLFSGRFLSVATTTSCSCKSESI